MFSGYVDFMGPFDRFIISLAGLMALVQIIIFFFYVLKIASFDRNLKALQWLEWWSHFFELFPLLGLLGTVSGLLNTFKKVNMNAENGLDISVMLGDFAYALTSTVSGIIALMANLFVFIVLIKIISVIEEGEVRR